ncbi:DUF1491 family protein [Pseudemcibacter aquimaris]|uniref:DUF1491 family protein n=1 Tax=Pseudemcibacter aquimaris TaxID=2857064 RepID=UPI002013B562|nr:DUF1491 family protein [Pseudemcibacter aquimaris]MCC3860141.1 DUF1491 family protein [Pseudemcibacter aquimaris]WDU57468.1 DUF1491 family protein [Pseudemcibacter aquimaris]
MQEIRLKSSIRVAAEIKRCEAEFIPAMVLHKGDEERGQIIIKQYVHGMGARIYSETRDMDDKLIWHEPLGEGYMEEQKADDYIVRQKSFDEDLWVIEIDDPKEKYVVGIIE